MKDIHDKTSPFVAFSTVQIFLIMSVFLGWYTCSFDFANAFIQATRPDEVFMHVPRGFKAKPNHCLRLIKNIYGACDCATVGRSRYGIKGMMLKVCLV